MTGEQLQRYLARIEYRGALDVTIETLRALHRAHLFHVPFENLDVPLGREIVCTHDAFYRKIVLNGRGGFCYEQNGLFADALRAMGFRVAMLSARVANAQGGFGEEFDHMALRVDLDEPWLADVGFGDSFHDPIPLERPSPTDSGGRIYRITRNGDTLLLERREHDGMPWEPQYRFTLTPHPLEAFAPMCAWQQRHSPSFSQKRICSLARPDGRISLTGTSLITTINGERREEPVTDDAHFWNLVRLAFGMDL